LELSMEKQWTKPGILVPLTSIVGNEEALGVAAMLSRATGRRLVLLWLASPDTRHPPAGDSRQTADDQSREYLDRVAVTLSQHAPEIVAHVEWARSNGERAAVIAHTAAKLDAKSIVMAAVRHGWASGLVPSLADCVVATSSLPVILTPPGHEPFRWKRVPVTTHLLVLLDGSSTDESVLAHARDLARSLRVRLVLIYAVSPVVLGESYVFTYRVADRILSYQCDEGRSYLGRIAQQLQRDGLMVRTHVQIGASVQVILAQAAPCSSAMIVLAADCPTPWRRWLLGSPVDELVGERVCPVVTIHGNQKSREPRVLRQDVVHDHKELPQSDSRPAGVR
jgi:nucleotide-binding universal stress UspA family protein